MRLALLTVLTALLIAPQAPTPQWRLSWSDEFNAPTGTLPDPAKWNIITGGSGFGNKESETYTARPENVQQSGGNLVITARREDFTGADGIPAHYTSARLNTQGHFAQAYGRFEARMKLPAGKGIWPAFWLLGDNVSTTGWPQCGEIDILEAIGEPATTYSTLHGPAIAEATPSPPTPPSPTPKPSAPPSTSTPSSGSPMTSSSSSTTPW